MSEVLLTVEHATKIYKKKDKEFTAIKDINFTVNKGEFISIVGPSGSGKTTILEILCGLRDLTHGTLKIKGETVKGPHPSIGIVFQEESTFPWRSLLDNVTFGLEMLGVPKKERIERAKQMIKIVGLEGFENAYPHELSGGMKQRVAIARTLVTNPEIVVMDEPFGALDEQTRMTLGGELLNIIEKTGATVILVTHSIQEAVLLSDRIIILSASPGRIREIIVNNLEKPRSENSLQSPKFYEISQQVWSTLEQEGLQKVER